MSLKHFVVFAFTLLMLLGCMKADILPLPASYLPDDVSVSTNGEFILLTLPEQFNTFKIGDSIGILVQNKSEYKFNYKYNDKGQVIEKKTKGKEGGKKGRINFKKLFALEANLKLLQKQKSMLSDFPKLLPVPLPSSSLSSCFFINEQNKRQQRQNRSRTDRIEKPTINLQTTNNKLLLILVLYFKT